MTAPGSCNYMSMRPVMTIERAQNQALNVAEYKAGKAVLESFPLILILEFTQNCNLSCPMCRQAQGYRKDWDMQVSTFEQAADELFGKAMIIDLRGFGESMLLRDFPRYVDRAADSGAHLRLVTNGQVNREEVWDRMMSIHSSILISCDAADDVLFRQLRQGGTLERLTDTVRAIAKVRDAYGAPRHLVSLLSIVSMQNLEDLPHLIDLAASLDIAKVSFFPIQVSLHDPRHLSSDPERVRFALSKAHERARSSDVELHVGAAMDVTLALREHVKSFCMHPWAFLYLSYDGGVGFCDQLIGNRKYLLGHLADGTLHSIWNNEAFQALRKAHASKALDARFAACRWCYKQRYIEYEHWVYPELAEHYVSTTTQNLLYATHACDAGDRLSFFA